jgi:hypothetical protein
MIAFGVIAIIVIKNILPYFDLFARGDRLIPGMIEPVPRVPPQPRHRPSFLLWELLARTVEGLSGVICLVFIPRIPARFPNHLRHF